MRKMKAAAAILCVLSLCFLCSCGEIFTETDKLLTPPELTGEMQPILEALSSSVDGEYTPVYPSSGDYRSAFVLKDVDFDKTNEAFAFYLKTNDTVTETHINYIKKTGGKWKSVADSALEAGSIEKVEFCDLNGDGILELLCGFEVFGSSEKRLGVYSPENKKLRERFMEKYTSFLCGDLNGDAKGELFVQTLNPAENFNTADIYTFTKDGTNKKTGCLLDGKVKAVHEIKLSKLEGGKTAVYIDEEKGIGSITEVLFMEGDDLVNPLFDGNKGENTATQRAVNLTSRDITGDGVPEIPTAIEMPMADNSGEKAYYTNWCGFDGEVLTVKRVTVQNDTDGYYLVLESKFYDSLALIRNTERRSRTFYEYTRDTATVGNRLFTVTAVDKNKENEFKADNENAKLIKEAGQTVFYAEVYPTAGDKITVSEIKEMFKIQE